jgi:hypothetical protein
MESSNAIQLVTSHVTGNNKSKSRIKRVKTDKVYKQKSVINNNGNTDKEKAEKLFGMKFKGE